MATEKAWNEAHGADTTGRNRYSTIAVGSVAYSSIGTNTTMVAGTTYYADVAIERNMTLTGIAVLNGATVGTDKGIVALYDTTGQLVANSALAGATTSGANTFQQYAFTTTVAVIGPARYFVVYQPNGTTDTIRTVATATFINVLASSATGAFGTLPSAITVPTTFTADKGPVAYVY